MPIADLLDKLNDATTIDGDYSLALPAGAGLTGAAMAGSLAGKSNSLIEKLFTKLHAQDPIAATGQKDKLRAVAQHVTESVPGVAFEQRMKDTSPLAWSTENEGARAINFNPKNIGGSTLLHEAGHLTPGNAKVPGALYQLSKSLYGPMLLSAAGISGYELGNNDSKYAPAVAAATAGVGLPHLLEELRASHVARRLAKAKGFPKPKGLNRAFMTYLMHPSIAAGVIAALGTGYAASKLSDPSN